MSEPLLDGDEIQASIVPGFSRPEQLLIAITVPDAASLREVLALCTGLVTSMSMAMPHKALRKAALLSGVDSVLPDPLWLSVSLGRRALDWLGESKVINLDPAFDALMWRPQGAGVTSRLGDPVQPLMSAGTPNPSYPPNWKMGGSQPIDMLLIFAANANVQARAEGLLTQITSIVGAASIVQQLGQLLPNNEEHFGFVDGISVPGMYGEYQSESGLLPVSTRYGVPSNQGVDFGRPGQPLCWPGQFILGYPPSAGGMAPANLPPRARNGSFLVFRRLNQDVEAFYRDTNALAGALASGLNNPMLDREHCQALIVGRWKNGEPVMRAPAAPAPIAEPFLSLNYFDFATNLPALTLSDGAAISGMTGDPTSSFGGQVCPSWAHLRKTNPRDLGTDVPRPTRTLQLLRRGVPFGPQFDHDNPDNPVNSEERGLLFLSYQTSIVNTFETIITDWMNNDLAPPPGKGPDLLVGQINGGAGQKLFTTVKPDGTDLPLTVAGKWVFPTGGAYLFTPSLSAIVAWSTTA